MNRLYYGDNLTIMSELPSYAVDLIYLDPPFNSNREYNAIYKDETGRPLPDQVEAFNDMWELDDERERAIRTMPVPHAQDLQSMVIEVKGGVNVGINVLRELKGVFDYALRAHGGADNHGAARNREGSELRQVHGGSRNA